jgi:pro-kumamolisin-like protein/Big-like domain-containing protein
MKTLSCVFALVLLLGSSSALAQTDRIATPINSSQTVALKGNVSPLAKPENDLGPLDPATKLPHVTMMMKLSPAQQAALDKLLVDQQDPSSRDYHQWLTPEQYGARFGLSQADMRKITQWLASQGFAIVEVARGRNWIAFGGTVDQIQRAFHTQIHRLTVDGEEHFANTTDPSVPKALQGMVSGFRGLDNFTPKPLSIIRKLPSANPYYTDGNGGNELAPDDIATIYNVAALYQAGIDGTGMKIGVMGQTDVHMTDIEQFRAGFNLSKNDPQDVLATGCTDPGYTGDEGEADLDLEWSGAVARNASILYIKCDSAKNGGVLGSLIYAVNQNIAPVLSMSYGFCEAKVNQSFATQYESLIQQANTQGQTMLVSSGDSGAATCDQGSTQATQGLSVNAEASPPEVTAVGGTEFDADVNNQSTYWNSTNGTNLGSAKSYIPELAWNDTASGTGPGTGQQLASTGGGVSIFYPKPAWQTGPGTYDSKNRSVPDVAMPASPFHDGYIFCTNVGGATYQGSCASGIDTAVANGSVVGGTSVACPVFAGIVALLNQSQKNAPPAGLGNINPTLYALSQSMPTAFHDVPAGNYSANATPTPSGNVVPCQAGSTNCTANGTLGYLTGANYDPVTGLGSVDAHALVTGWPSTSKTSTATTLAITPANPVPVGATVTFTATITPAPPDGETVTFTDTISHTTLGTATTTAGKAVATSSTIAAGSYTVVASYPGDTTFAASASTGRLLTVGQGTTATTTTLTVAPGNSVPVGTTVTFTATITPAPPNGETVTFKDSMSSTTLGTGTTTTGKAVFTSTTLAKGSYNVVASYPGDANFSASVSAGQALNVGVTTTTTTTTLAIAPGGTVNAGTSVTFTAAITPAPPNGETVTFTDTISNRTLGTANTASGVAAFISTTIAAGSYAVVANYPGDANFGASVSAGQALTVQKASTTTTLAIAPGNSVTPGTSVTFTAKVSPASGNPMPTGTVTFNNGSIPLGAIQLSSGTAVLTTNSMAAGSYSVTAAYGGDTNSAGSSSSPVALAVVDFIVTAGQSSLSVVRGQSVQTSLTVTPSPLATFSPTVTFSCSGLPSGSSCSFSPGSVTPNGAPLATTLTIQTSASAARMERASSGHSTGLLYALLLPGCLILSMKRKCILLNVRFLGLLATLTLSIMFSTACGTLGTTGPPPPPPPVTATVTITATSSGATPISKQVAIQLTVQ